MKVELKPTILLKGLKSFKEHTWQLGFYEIIPFEAGHFQIYVHSYNEYITKEFDCLSEAKKFLINMVEKDLDFFLKQNARYEFVKIVDSIKGIEGDTEMTTIEIASIIVFTIFLIISTAGLIYAIKI